MGNSNDLLLKNIANQIGHSLTEETIDQFINPRSKANKTIFVTAHIYRHFYDVIAAEQQVKTMTHMHTAIPTCHGNCTQYGGST